MTLLLQRQEIADLAKVSIIFQADKSVFPEIAGEPQRRGEIRFAGLTESDVHDRIGDELPLRVADSDDRSYFQRPPRQRELRHLVAEFEIDAVEEAAFGGVRDDEQTADLGPIGKELACAVNREWQIEASLPPFGQTVGKLRSTLQAVVRAEAARKPRLRLSHRRIVEVLLVGPLSDFRDLGVVDLDLVVDLVGGQGGP